MTQTSTWWGVPAPTGALTTIPLAFTSAAATTAVLCFRWAGVLATAGASTVRSALAGDLVVIPARAPVRPAPTPGSSLVPLPPAPPPVPAGTVGTALAVVGEAGSDVAVVEGSALAVVEEAGTDLVPAEHGHDQHDHDQHGGHGHDEDGEDEEDIPVEQVLAEVAAIDETDPHPDTAPVPNWDELSLPSIRARLRHYSLPRLRQLHAYELDHAGRPGVLSMLENRITLIESSTEGGSEG
ncbi:hypothetical protein [Kineococcus glutinatus]|uniref:Uncharacterized protein n=1 Tax=Kineococcus glutinatus TaxID=1070872 RepID=A0ABP9HXW5_9ACTN